MAIETFEIREVSAKQMDELLNAGFSDSDYCATNASGSCLFIEPEYGLDHPELWQEIEGIIGSADPHVPYWIRIGPCNEPVTLGTMLAERRDLTTRLQKLDAEINGEIQYQERLAAKA